MHRCIPGPVSVLLSHQGYGQLVIVIHSVVYLSFSGRESKTEEVNLIL